MTVEKVEFYRIMLLVGLGDGFYREFDRLLEEEDPLSDLTLSLCTCISDENEVLHILREYTLNYSVDNKKVCDLILEDLRGRFLTGEMTRVEITKLLHSIPRMLNKFWDHVWNELTVLDYGLELWEDGMICEAAFIRCFDAWLFRGESLNPWRVQEEIDSRNHT